MADQPDKAADKAADKPATPSDPSGVPHVGAPHVNDGTVNDDDASQSDRDRSERNASADRGLTDFVRRAVSGAVSAGVGAASRSKDDIMRAAASEVRTWLDRLDVNNEVLKALSKMTIEIKTEIKFRRTDDGRVAAETSNDVKVK
jgi:hypothetical protein